MVLRELWWRPVLCAEPGQGESVVGTERPQALTLPVSFIRAEGPRGLKG